MRIIVPSEQSSLPTTQSMNNNNNSNQTNVPSTRQNPETNIKISTKPTNKTSRRINATEDGYNSEDEHCVRRRSANMKALQNIVSHRAEDFKTFEEELLKKKGFVILKMAEDGNCLFRAIAHQIYGDPEMHDVARERCMKYMLAERDHYSQFVVEDFDEYISRKSKDRVYGNNLEIQAIGELFSRPIEIYTFKNGLQEPINIFHDQYETDNAPIRLSYHNGNHYNSVIDPNNPTVGVGLGLPNFEPGLADKSQMMEAVKQSEHADLEETILKESSKQSELEIAEKLIEDAIIAQSEREIEDKLLEQEWEEAIISQTQLDAEEAILEQSKREYEEAILAQSRQEYFNQINKHS